MFYLRFGGAIASLFKSISLFSCGVLFILVQGYFILSKLGVVLQAVGAAGVKTAQR